MSCLVITVKVIIKFSDFCWIAKKGGGYEPKAEVDNWYAVQEGDATMLPKNPMPGPKKTQKAIKIQPKILSHKGKIKTIVQNSIKCLHLQAKKKIN
jgi:hypothetical protein